jgi:flagellar biogenesis protein FliO
MTTWQAVISTATQSPHSSDLPGADAGSSSARGSKSKPAFTSILRPIATHAAAAWKWLERKRTQQLAVKRLHVAETIQLGEKRFVSIIQVDGAQFLIGGAAGNVSLLAVLNQGQMGSVTCAVDANASTEVKR